MARTVKPEAVASKRRKILDAAQRLVLTKGYEQMSIQDVLDLVGISSGAFHHYFGSREELLDALIEQINQESQKPLLPIIHDPNLSAVEKLRGFFDTLDRLRISHRAEVIQLLRGWYTDDNAFLRLKVDEALLRKRAPLLTEIIRQGIREGFFNTAYPEQAGEIIQHLLEGMGNTHARLLLSFEQKECDDERRIEEMVAVHAAYLDVIERVLGAPPQSFSRTDAEAVKVWVAGLRENDH